MHELHLRYQRSRAGLVPLYITASLRAAAIASLSLFTPVYIYSLARELGLDFVSAMNIVILFLVILYSSKIVGLFVGSWISSRYGYKSTIRSSFLPFALFLFAFFVSNENLILVNLASVFWGLNAGLYWWGYHGVFVKKADIGRIGFSIGKIEFVSTIASIITPLLGGAIIQFFDFRTFLIFVAAIMALSFLVIGEDSDEVPIHKLEIKKVFSQLAKRLDLTLAFAGSGGEFMIFSLFWPLALFIFVGSNLGLGILITLSAFFSAMFGLTVGKLSDRNKQAPLLVVGSPLMTATWAIRFLASSSFFYVFADSLYKFAQKAVHLTLLDLNYLDGKQASAPAIMFREAGLFIGSSLVLIIVCFWINFAHNLQIIYVLGGFFSLAPLIPVIRHRLK